MSEPPSDNMNPAYLAFSNIVGSQNEFKKKSGIQNSKHHVADLSSSATNKYPKTSDASPLHETFFGILGASQAIK